MKSVAAVSLISCLYAGMASGALASQPSLERRSMVKMENVCGQYCLTSILQHFGRSVRMGDLLPALPASRNGCTLAQLKVTAEGYELHALGVRLSPDLLFAAHLPAILHVNSNHFIALLPQAVGPGYTVIDPPESIRISAPTELTTRWKWKGNCLILSDRDIVLPEAQGRGRVLGRCLGIVLAVSALVLLLGRRWFPSRHSARKTGLPEATLVIVALFVGVAQGVPKAALDAVPRISVEHPTFDAGILFDNTQEISHAFEISNKGTADLVVKEIRTDCSCTAVESNRIKKIPAGASTSLTVRFHLGERFGKLPERKTLLVTNDPVNPKTVLVMRAERYREFTVEPPLLLPGRIPLGRDKILFLRMTAYDNHRLPCVEKAVASCPFVQVSEVKGTNEDAKRGVRLLRVRVLPTAPSGPLEATIRIPCTGGFRQMLEVRLRGEIVGPIRLSLAQLQFGLIAADSRPATRRVVLTSAQPFEILALKGSPAWVSVAEHADGHDDGRRSVVVTLVPSQGLKGRAEGLVTVETDMPEMHVIRIPVFAYFL